MRTPLERARFNASEPSTTYSTKSTSLAPSQGLVAGFSDSPAHSVTPAASSAVSMP